MDKLTGSIIIENKTLNGDISQIARWGLIGGDINAQEDLIEELDKKQPLIDSEHKLDVDLIDGFAEVAKSGSYNDLSDAPQGLSDFTDDLGDNPPHTHSKYALNVNFNEHIADESNPHSVTKAQVGLGNVDNTSDLDKPISNATQDVLDNKQDKLTPGQNITIQKVGDKTIISSTGGGGGGGAVDSVNGKTGVVVLVADDINADNNQTIQSNLDRIDNKFSTLKTSDLTNDSGFIDSSALEGYATETYVNNYHDSTKQNTITDLDDIRDGAEAGSTAVQPSAISDMATKTWVGNQGFLTEHQSLANYDTKSEVNAKIQQAIYGAMEDSY